jgi:hypothetical protein
MEFLTREEIMNDYKRTLYSMMNKYDLDDIGIYEEEGPGDEYYFGYTIRKNGKVFIVNLPYKKNEKGELAIKEHKWTLQANGNEEKGFRTLDEVFTTIQRGLLH